MSISMKKLKKLAKNYTPNDFEKERTRRSMFSYLKLDEKPPVRKLADQLLIIGNNATNPNETSPQILYQYPKEEISDFTYDIFVDYCFPKGVKRTKRTAKTVEAIELEIKKSNQSHKHVSHFFVFHFCSSIPGLLRYAICLSKTRIVRDTVNPLMYYEDDVIYILLTMTKQFYHHISFLETLLDMNEVDQLALGEKLSNSLIQVHIDEYMQNTSEDVIEDIKSSIIKNPIDTADINLCRCLMFRVIPVEHLLTLVSAIMLEKKIFIVSQYKCLVSNVILFLTEVIHPFHYDFSIIDVLTDQLIDLLDSPTPLVVGCYEKPKYLPDEYYYYDIDNKKMEVKGPKTIPFPNAENIQEEMKLLLHPLMGCPAHSTLKCIKDHSSIIDKLLNCIKEEIDKIIKPFDFYCLSSQNAPIISLFMKTEFVMNSNENYQPFLKEFVETQMFENFKTLSLVRYDKRMNDNYENQKKKEKVDNGKEEE